MASRIVPRLRMGALALAIASLLFLVSVLIRPSSDPAVNSNPLAHGAAAAQLFADANFGLSDMMYILAFPLLIFGNLALYVYLSRRVDGLAFLGMVASVAGAAIFLAFIGIGAFALPASGQVYLDGGTDAMAVVQLILEGPATVVAIVGAVLLLAGAILVAVAVWRDGGMPRWAALLYALGFLFFLGTPALPPAITLVPGVLIAVGGCWLAFGLWQKAPEVVAPLAVSLPTPSTSTFT